jgi:N-dimethylarginine dimethylaminohydrolase
MKNSTTSAVICRSTVLLEYPPARNPHVPHQRSIASKSKSKSNRWPGEVRTRRPRIPQHLTDKQIQEILESQRKHGVGPGAKLDKPCNPDATSASSPDDELQLTLPATDGLMTSQASRTTPWDSVSRLGDWLQSFWRHEDAPTPAVKQSNVAIARYRVDYPGLNDLNDLAKTEKEYVHALEKFVGERNVEVFDNPRNAYPYLRNVAGSAPDGTVLTSHHEVDLDQGQVEMRTRIERHFQKMGVPTRRLDSSVNFANVQYLSTQDALVLASSKFAPLTESAAQELKRVFGEPKHILRVELNTDLQRGDWPICYDLDLAFHMTVNAQGEPVALVHKPCISADPAAGELGSEVFVSQLKALGFRVIEISAKDQLSLATNFVTSDDRPGEALFARDNLSEGLLRQLQEAGIQPVFADGQGKKLGYTGRAVPIWGLHCLTVNFHKPADGEPKRKDL